MIKNLTMKNRIEIVALGLLFSTQSIGQDDIIQNPTVYPHLFVGVKGGATLSTLDSATETPVYSAFIGSQFSEHWSWDLGYQYHGNVDSLNNSTDINAFDSAIRHDWYIANDVSVYGKLGIAYWNMKKSNKYGKPTEDNGFSPLAEIGLNYRMTPHVSLNAGYQYLDKVGNDKVGQYNSRSLMAGISYHFEGKEKTQRQKIVPVEIKSVVKPTPSLPPSTPTPTATAITKVFATTIQSDVAFNFDSAAFVPNAEVTAKLHQLIQLLNKYPMAHVQIVGHTDSIGTVQYNKQLSEKRAQSVFNALKREGVDENRLSIVAKGESQPIASNMYAPGREKNRRVELIVMEFKYSADE